MQTIFTVDTINSNRASLEVSLLGNYWKTRHTKNHNPFPQVPELQVPHCGEGFLWHKSHSPAPHGPRHYDEKVHTRQVLFPNQNAKTIHSCCLFLRFWSVSLLSWFHCHYFSFYASVFLFLRSSNNNQSNYNFAMTFHKGQK